VFEQFVTSFPRYDAHPASPRSDTLGFAGDELDAAVSAMVPGHSCAVWRPVLSRPRFENKRRVVPASGCSGDARPRPHTVTASCALCGRSRNCDGTNDQCTMMARSAYLRQA
jgi:hypothetical protein